MTVPGEEVIAIKNKIKNNRVDILGIAISCNKVFSPKPTSSLLSSSCYQKVLLVSLDISC